jgi:hypothetical protein
MEEQVKSISSLIAAFETRNELLHEEIKMNEQAIKDMEKQLILIQETEEPINIKKKDKKVEVVA